MSDPLIEYYQKYFEVHPEDGYQMAKIADTSRVKFLLQFIQQYCPIGGNITDIGCGDMYLSTQLKQFNWVGLDINTSKALGKCIQTDLSKGPYPIETASQDLVLSSEFLEHVWDLRVVHQEVRRIIKPVGTYIISTPNFDNIDWVLATHRQVLFNPEWSHSFEHIRWYNYETHKKFLEDAGFEVIHFAGADAHMAGFFQEARAILQHLLKSSFNIEVEIAQVDQMLGLMWKKIQPSIILISRPKI